MIQIKVSPNRLSNSITVEEYMAMEEGRVTGMFAVLSRFVIDDNGNYLPLDDAKNKLKKLKLEELKSLVNEFTRQSEEAAAGPKAPTESTEPTTQT